MTEALNVAARALGVLATAYLLGSCAFLLRSGSVVPPLLGQWQARVAAGLPIAALGLVLALFGSLWAQAAAILGTSSVAALLDARMQIALITETHFGRVWLARCIVAGLLVLVLVPARRRSVLGAPAVLLAALVLAALAGALTPLTGHASGDELAVLRVPAHMAHILALGLWLGGLPAWIGLVRRTRGIEDPQVRDYVAAALQRFSRFALGCMAVIVVSGIVVAEGFVDDQGDLLGTRYGLLLLAKLLLLAGVLAIAQRLRRDFVPVLHALPRAVDSGAAMRRVRIELFLGVVVLLLGAWLAQTTPALHDQPRWWLPLRISIEATWPQWPSVPFVLGGFALLALAAAFVLRPQALVRRLAAPLATAAGLGIALYGVAVPAFPDSFRRSDVPYLVDSIAQGRALFEQHCTSCHGSGGLGDGVQAAALRVQPANLSEPHTALHTAGDMFWWFSHGIPASGMPGYADRLGETERWDLVNFLRAFSQGFEARVLGPQVQLRQPWLGAPTFYFEDADGQRGDLKDHRRRNAVLLVFVDTDAPDARERIAALADARPRLEAAGARIIVVDIGEPPTQIELSAGLTVLGGDAARTAWQSYQLLSRTLADRGDADRIGMHWRHAEFLIDRFGYIRARWIPQEAGAGWTDIDLLLHQVVLLRQEPELEPPPDLHLH